MYRLQITLLCADDIFYQTTKTRANKEAITDDLQTMRAFARTGKVKGKAVKHVLATVSKGDSTKQFCYSY